MEIYIIGSILIVILIFFMFNLYIIYNQLSELEDKINEEIEKMKKILNDKLSLINEFYKYINIDYEILEKIYNLKENIDTCHDINDLYRYSKIIEAMFNEIEMKIDLSNLNNDKDIKMLLAKKNSLDNRFKAVVLDYNEYVSSYNDLLDKFEGKILKIISDFQKKDYYEEI